jgi:hypothetical protein
MTRRGKLWLAVMTAFILLAPSCRHDYDALLVLGDLARIDVPLIDARSNPSRQNIRIAGNGALREADTYVPGGSARAGLVLVPGAAAGGRNDARLVELATTLSRSGFVVLVPDIPSLRELRPAPESAAGIAAALISLSAMPELPPDAPLGIGAFSVAVGPAVLAAMEPEALGRLDFLLLVGGYHDLERTLAYMTTGYFRADGQVLHREPNAYGKWVYALSNARRLESPGDREALTALARRKLDDPEADVTDLVSRLSPSAMAVYDLIGNTDPERVPALIDSLPPGVRGDIERLDLARRDLGGLQGRCLLVHGLDDDVIPYSESVFLAQALSGCRVELHLLQGLQHVDRAFSGLDMWRFWRVLESLLSQRN